MAARPERAALPLRLFRALRGIARRYTTQKRPLTLHSKWTRLAPLLKHS
jgi:hypothetical protein